MNLSRDIDWKQFLITLQRWAKLSTAARDRYLDGSINDTLTGAVLGDQAKELMTLGFIYPVNPHANIPPGQASYKRVDKNKRFLTQMRHFRRFPLFDQPGLLGNYVTFFFSPFDIAQFNIFDPGCRHIASLNDLADSGRAARFLTLDINQLARKLTVTSSTFDLTKFFLEDIIRSGGTIDSASLLDFSSRYSPTHFADILHLCLDQCLLFATLRAETLDWTLGVWSATAQSLPDLSAGNRQPPDLAPAPSNRPAKPSWPARVTIPAVDPLAAPASLTPALPQVMSVTDMTTLLVYTTAGSVRLRQGGDFYAKAVKELTQALAPTPDSLNEVLIVSSTGRLYTARTLLYELHLVAPRHNREGHIHLQPAKKANDWLALSDKDKLGSLLQLLKTAWKKEDSLSYSNTFLHAQLRSGLDSYRYYALDRQIMPTLWQELTAIVKSAGPGFVYYRPFLEHLIDQRNLLGQLLGDKKKNRLFQYLSGSNETDSLSETLYDNFMLKIAIPFGLIDIAGHQGKLCFRFNSVARYFFGLTGDFDYGAPAAAPEVIVQPDFNITFLTPSPQTEALLARFAERQGHQLGTLFKITRASVIAAAAGKLNGDAILATLDSVAKTGVPDNVRREIAGWCAQCRTIKYRNAILLECDSPEDALRTVSKAGKNAARLITDRIVEIQDNNPRQLFTKLRKEGLFIDQARD